MDRGRAPRSSVSASDRPICVNQQLVGRLEARRREREELLDRWIGRVVGGVLAVKLLLAVVLVVFGFVIY